MSACSQDSVRMFPASQFPIACKIYFESVSNDDRHKLFMSSECFDEVEDAFLVGDRFSCFADKSQNVWEVVRRDVFIPQIPNDGTFTSVIVCGCKLIASIAVK